MGITVTAVVLVVLGLGAVGAALGPWDLGPGRGGIATVAVLLVAAGAVFGLVGGVVGDDTLDVADLPVLGGMVALRSPAATATAETLSLVGGTVVTGGLGVVTAVVLALRGRRRWALIWVAGVAVGSLAIRGIKVAVDRPRPPVAARLAEETTASLPSGHSLMAALGLGLTAAAAVALGRGAWRTVVAALAVAATIAIGASRAYLGVHWATDVVGGWLLGAAIATACLALARILDARSTADPPAGPPEMIRTRSDSG